MSLDVFEIRFKNWADNRWYKAMVEVTYRSDSVIRFSITAGEKLMLMEKLLYKKTGQWKITSLNFEMRGDPKDSAILLMRIQEAIDYQVEKLFGK